MKMNSFLLRSVAIVVPALIVLMQASPVQASSPLEGSFLLGERVVAIEKIGLDDLRWYLTPDWRKFDTYVKESTIMFTNNKVSVHWYQQITPPFPTHWPPQEVRSVTYYGYAEYAESNHHGPAYGRSAPWVKIVLTEGQPAVKHVLVSSLGAEVHGQGSHPISHEMAARLVQIHKDGEKGLPAFIGWKRIPDDAVQVQVIKDYYCQWMIENRTGMLVREAHQAFFDWLSCPAQNPIIPVLGY
jgi:hypothetical protein